MVQPSVLTVRPQSLKDLTSPSERGLSIETPNVFLCCQLDRMCGVDLLQLAVPFATLYQRLVGSGYRGHGFLSSSSLIQK